MHQNVESSILDLDKIPKDDCNPIPLKCTRSITCKDESLTVNISSLKWTFNYDFCVRVTALPQGAPNVSKQLHLAQSSSLA